ncbi:MAG: hypothetical protein QM831_03030 [Kofleriaceae bacterium]
MREQVVAIYEKVRAVEDRVALELAVARNRLRLFVVIEQPGESHGRYSMVGLETEWPAGTEEDYDAAIAIGRAVAQSAGLPFVHARFGIRSSPAQWIERQPDAMAVYGFHWRARWFDVDARPHHAIGLLDIEARAGNEARTLARDRVIERHPARPLTVWIDDDQTDLDPVWPYRRISQHNVRVFATRSSYDASAIARNVIAVAPDTTAVQLRMVFRFAFFLRDGELDPVGAWHRREIDDRAFTAAMPAIAAGHLNWDLGVRIEDARRNGCVAAVIAEELSRRTNTIEVIKMVREVFDVGLSQAMMFVEDARSGDPIAVDAKYRQILGLR